MAHINHKSGFSISVVLFLLLAVVIGATIFAVSQKTSLLNFASGGTKQTASGILVSAPNKCDFNNSTVCYKLLNEQGKIVRIISPDRINVKNSDLKKIAGTGKTVIVSGVEKTTKNKSGSKSLTYLSIYKFELSTQPIVTPSPITTAPAPAPVAQPVLTKSYLEPFGMAGDVGIGQDSEYWNKWFVESGARETSFGISWSALQPNKNGPITFSSWLDKIGNACSHQIVSGSHLQCHILFNNSPPSWAKGTESNCGVDPAHFDDMANAAAQVANHFSKNTIGLQFLNEPDLAGCSPSAYATMLKKTYQAIKKLSPSYPVLMGRLASDPATYHSDQFLVDVLKYSRDNLGGQYFDVLDLHYYDWFPQYSFEPFHSADSYSARVDDQGNIRSDNPGGGIRGKTIWAKKLLNEFGIGDKLITYSEVGKETGNYTATDTELQNQAQAVFRLYSQAFSAGAQQVSWYCLGDAGPGCQIATTSRQGVKTPYVHADFSLALLNGGSRNSSNLPMAEISSFRPAPYSPRPAYIAYQTLSGELSDSLFNSLDADPGVEGYIFHSQSSKSKEVLWSRSSSAVSKSFPAKSLMIKSYIGKVFNAVDGGTGDMDNKTDSKITVTITTPVIVIW